MRVEGLILKSSGLRVLCAGMRVYVSSFRIATLGSMDKGWQLRVEGYRSTG